MKPTKDFRMKASSKVALALGNFKDAHDRGRWKRALIDAQLCEEKARRDSQRGKAKDDE